MGGGGGGGWGAEVGGERAFCIRISAARGVPAEKVGRSGQHRRMESGSGERDAALAQVRGLLGGPWIGVIPSLNHI